MKNQRVFFLTQTAAIAALYAALTLVSGALGLSGGAVQLRLSEALTVLPYFTPAAVPGLFLGCILSNLLTGSVLLDVFLGSAATLLGAVLSRALRNKKQFVPVPPILTNTLIIPFVLQKAYGMETSYGILMLTVGLGEVLSCGVLGMLLLKTLEPRAGQIFGR